MTKKTNTMRIDALENSVNEIRGNIADLNTAINRLCDLLEPKATAPKTKKNAGKKPAKKAADKPTTYGEAIAQWKADKGITPESTAAYKAYRDAEYAKRWAKWVESDKRNKLTGDARKAANKEMSAKIYADIKRDWAKKHA